MAVTPTLPHEETAEGVTVARAWGAAYFGTWENRMVSGSMEHWNSGTYSSLPNSRLCTVTRAACECSVLASDKHSMCLSIIHRYALQLSKQLCPLKALNKLQATHACCS